MRRLLRRVRAHLRAILSGVFSAHPGGHFYSPVCDPKLLEQDRARLWPEPPVLTLPGIDFDDAGHVRILEDWFPRYIGDFDYPARGPRDAQLTGYYTGNSQFTWLDARTLFVFLRALTPRRIIEVGSGYSSLLMADVNQRFLGGRVQIRCIEPFPRPFLRTGVPGISEVIERPVQAVPLTLFTELDAGDILFIDSSHVSKTGSDVNHLVFEVLPRLAPGVLIHLHDIFLPAEYLEDWAVSENRSWNEQYLLRALLMHSTAFKPMFGCNYAWLRHPDKVIRALALPDGQGFGGGSFWMRRV